MVRFYQLAAEGETANEPLSDAAIVMIARRTARREWRIDPATSVGWEDVE